MRKYFYIGDSLSIVFNANQSLSGYKIEAKVQWVTGFVERVTDTSFRVFLNPITSSKLLEGLAPVTITISNGGYTKTGKNLQLYAISRDNVRDASKVVDRGDMDLHILIDNMTFSMSFTHVSKSPYQYWVESGNEGSEADYQEFLRQPAKDAANMFAMDELQRRDNEAIRIANEIARQRGNIDLMANISKSEELITHPPKLLSEDNRLIWHYWDLNTKRYVSTGIQGLISPQPNNLRSYRRYDLVNKDHSLYLSLVDNNTYPIGQAPYWSLLLQGNEFYKDVQQLLERMNNLEQAVSELKETDEVLEYVSKYAFPNTGKAKTLYIDISTNTTYRYDVGQGIYLQLDETEYNTINGGN